MTPAMTYSGAGLALTEIWKKSPIGPSFIEVSNCGRVRTASRLTEGMTKAGRRVFQRRPPKMLSPCVSNNGYLYVPVKDGKSKKKYLLHRLIASAFYDGFDENLSVNHISGNKLDNFPENLEWVTLAQNTRHQWRTGLIDTCGENHPSHKLKNADVAQVFDLLKGGKSVKSVAQKFNVSESLIYKIAQGKKRCSIYQKDNQELRAACNTVKVDCN